MDKVVSVAKEPRPSAVFEVELPPLRNQINSLLGLIAAAIDKIDPEYREQLVADFEMAAGFMTRLDNFEFEVQFLRDKVEALKN
jgi:hypothetical protein